MNFTKTSGFLAAAFLAATLMLTGCGTDTGQTWEVENTLHGDHNTVINSDGLYYVFDFKEKTAQYVLHDGDGWGNDARYYADLIQIEDAPEAVQKAYETAYNMTAYNRSGSEDGAVWQVTSLDHELDNIRAADLLVLDPVSLKTFVINTKVDMDISADELYNGVVYDPVDLPEYLMPEYERQLKAYGLSEEAIDAEPAVLERHVEQPWEDNNPAPLNP